MVGPCFLDWRVVFRPGFGNDRVRPVDDSVVLGRVFNRDSGSLPLDNVPQSTEILR
jgi:hypothetical protein